MIPDGQKALIRLAILFGFIPAAFLIGYATGSEAAFIVVMAVGLSVSIVLRFTVLR
ncbi:MAG: hypothetical protein ACRDNY_08715 [Gaiellaceae bacterium]